MTEPLLPLIETFKIIIQILIGSILLLKWSRAGRRFFTDMPFLFGVAMFFAAAGESLDVFFDSGILPIDLFLFKIRTSLVAFTLFFYLTTTILIWFVDRRRLGYLLIAIYMVVLFTVIWLAPTINLVRLWVMPLLFILFIQFIITFILVWWMKRLPDVHGLIMALGVIIAMIGQILKVPLSLVMLTWVSELIDLIGLSILALGLLLRPSYAKTQPTNDSN